MILKTGNIKNSDKPYDMKDTSKKAQKTAKGKKKLLGHHRK
jgi:hypothetical protein